MISLEIGTCTLMSSHLVDVTEERFQSPVKFVCYVPYPFFKCYIVRVPVPGARVQQQQP